MKRSMKRVAKNRSTTHADSFLSVLISAPLSDDVAGQPSGFCDVFLGDVGEHLGVTKMNEQASCTERHNCLLIGECN
jgi:hypothetical protein